MKAFRGQLHSFLCGKNKDEIQHELHLKSSVESLKKSNDIHKYICGSKTNQPQTHSPGDLCWSLLKENKVFSTVLILFHKARKS